MLVRLRNSTYLGCGPAAPQNIATASGRVRHKLPFWRHNMNAPVVPARSSQSSAEQDLAATLDPVVAVPIYERVVSLLMSLLMVFGLPTGALGLVWFGNQQWFVSQPPSAIDVQDFLSDTVGGGDENGRQGASLNGPGGSDRENEVLLEGDSDDVVADLPPMDVLAAGILDAVGGAVMIDELLVGSDAGGVVDPLGGSPRGNANKRNVGIGKGDEGGIRQSNRWQIVIEGQSEKEYFRQLDFFGVELGAIVDGRLYYVTKLSTAHPVMRAESNPAKEMRLSFSFLAGGRRQTDLNICKTAGVPIIGDAATVLHFFPDQLVQRLMRIEREYATGRVKDDPTTNRPDFNLIRKTKFVVKAISNGYDFAVARQDYFVPGK